MINQEEYIRRVMQRTAILVIQNLLRTKEYSAKFLTRADSKTIDRMIEKMSIEVVDEFIKALKSRGYLGSGEMAGEEEFQALFETTVKGYLERLGQNNNNSK
jgi:hypothetical protein